MFTLEKTFVVFSISYNMSSFSIIIYPPFASWRTCLKSSTPNFTRWLASRITNFRPLTSLPLKQFAYCAKPSSSTHCATWRALQNQHSGTGWGRHLVRKIASLYRKRKHNARQEARVKQHVEHYTRNKVHRLGNSRQFILNNVTSPNIYILFRFTYSTYHIYFKLKRFKYCRHIPGWLEIKQ